jgi:methylmalonyl-CoA epimerase
MDFFAQYTIDHVGIILPSLSRAEEFATSFGMVEAYRGYVEPWSCWCLFMATAEGRSQVELVVPNGGPLAKFNKGVGGVHHFAYAVDDIERVSEQLMRQGMRMLEPRPIKGAGNFLCNFIHPLSTLGVNIELVQPL